MNGWVRFLALSAQARAGYSPGIVVWAMVALLAGLASVGFFLVAAFVWLADRYDAVAAGLVLGFLLLLLALIALVACLLTRRHNIEQARLELAARKGGAAGWLDPKLLATGYQIGQSIGWRKLASLGVVAVLAAVLAREWLDSAGQDESKDDETNL